MPVQGVSNVDLGPDTARSNLLTNGGFDVWQRGGGPFTSSGAYGPDRWVLYAPVGTINISLGATTNTDNSLASGYCFFGAGSAGLYQIIEGYLSLAGRTISMSIRVKANAANSIRFGFSPDHAGTLPTQWSNYHSGGNGWETLTVTYAVPGSATGLTVWLINTLTATVVFDNAMLVVGSQAADYAPMHPADDLARCLRYYQKLGGWSGWPSTYRYASAAGVNIEFWAQFPTVMALTPTVTKVGTWTPGNCGQPAVLYAGPGAVMIYAVSSAAGQCFFYCNTTNEYATAEANP